MKTPTSTIVKEGANKEVLGILVSYRVKVKLLPPTDIQETDTPVNTNFIEFEINYGQKDDIVSEDFACLRLKGLKDDKEDDDHFC
ncbi:UNVERIFIED_CONTAM: hypothetical protein K2H54_048784 [Gekko kuhli]